MFNWTTWDLTSALRRGGCEADASKNAPLWRRRAKNSVKLTFCSPTVRRSRPRRSQAKVRLLVFHMANRDEIKKISLLGFYREKRRGERSKLGVGPASVASIEQIWRRQPKSGFS